MSNISPKLIDVEGNRVGDKVMKATEHSRGNDIYKLGFAIPQSISYEAEGRFPTQLFTNIKNDRFKYVKNIT
jgi:hypothetical protein